MAGLILCASQPDLDGPGLSVPEKTFHRYFGYALVDCGVDDPLDAVAKSNYVSEVASFTNIGQMCVFDPAEAVTGRLQEMTRNRMKALLSVQEIFFVGTPDKKQGSGMKFRLRPDYRRRWNAFVQANDLINQQSAIAAFYVADEPVWNGISFAHLKTASDTIKASFPEVPAAIVEAAPALRKLKIPTSIDWVGFDHYAVPTPDTDGLFRTELALLKSKRSRSSQKIMLIMEGQWLPSYGKAGYAEADMEAVASSYYRVAKADPDIIAVVGYLWPGGLDDPKQKGTRNLPQNVIDEHKRIGRLMIGK